ncbi:MAG: type II secretion system protein [Bacilli bacterium]|nr:type II secretion system protein [Bacilli bacterium]
MKKGFTLIELLAVITILGIIALITTPIILNVIEQAKEKSYLLDADNIARTINSKMLDEGVSISGTYTKEQAQNLLNINFDGDEIIVTLVEDVPYVSLIVNGNSYLSNHTKIYGLEWDGNDNYTRLEDAVGMVANAGVDDEVVVNDFDTAQIYSEMKDVIEDGNSFVKIPKFYIKKVVNGDDWQWYISKIKVDDDYYLPACFMDETDNEVLDYILVGKYDASLEGDKLVSKSGTTPLVSKTITEFRTYALNNNVGDVSGYQLIDIHTIDVLQVLFYVEFGTLNSQDIMMGFVNGSAANTSGQTDTVVASSGSLTSNTDGLSSMMYRGIENLYGNVWQMIDGISVDNSTHQFFVNRNSDSYETDSTTGDYYVVGYSQLYASGYITKMGYDNSNPFIQFPIAITGGSLSAKYADKYSIAADSEMKILYFGGRWYSGLEAGINNLYTIQSSVTSAGTAGARIVKNPS